MKTQFEMQNGESVWLARELEAKIREMEEKLKVVEQGKTGLRLSGIFRRMYIGS